MSIPGGKPSVTSSSATAVGTMPAEQPVAFEQPETDVTLWAVVFAGGIGSRFWPLSTPARPMISRTPS